jgi:hypothetical protein
MPQPVSINTMDRGYPMPRTSRSAVERDLPLRTAKADENFRNRFASTPDVWIEGAAAMRAPFRRFTSRGRMFDGYIYVDRAMRPWRFVHTVGQAYADKLTADLAEYGDAGVFLLTTHVLPGVRLPETCTVVEVR